MVLTELRLTGPRYRAYTTAYLNLAFLLILVSLSVPTVDGRWYVMLHMLPVQAGMLMLCAWFAVYVLWGPVSAWERGAFALAAGSMVAAGLGAWKVVPTGKWFSIVTQSIGLFGLYLLGALAAAGDHGPGYEAPAAARK